METLHFAHFSLVLDSTESDAKLQMCLMAVDPLPQPDGNAFPKTSQLAVGQPFCKGTLLTHVQLCVHQDPQVLFCQAAVLVPGVFCPQMQEFSLPLVELHEVPISPFL